VIEASAKILIGFFCAVHVSLQELVYLEEDERMLEEVYPQGEKVQNCFQGVCWIYSCGFTYVPEHDLTLSLLAYFNPT
jgi:hypothetical protein